MGGRGEPDRPSASAGERVPARIASPAAESILERLDGVKPLGTGWVARCPAHDDVDPSLKVDVDESGKVLLHCHAGCEPADVVAAIGLELADLFPPRKRGRDVKATNGQRFAKGGETRYEGRDAASGELVGYHVRIDYADGSKKVFWRRPDGSNGLAGYPLEQLALYGAEAIGRAKGVIVVEGEKARDALRARGIVAVGTMTGASGTPGDDALAPLVGRLVALWPDNDDAGRRHMERIAARLDALGHPRDCLVRVEWNDAPPKGDAADWTGTTDELRESVASALPWPFSANGKHDPGEQAQKPDDGPFHLTDLGNARRLVRMHGADLRHVRRWEQWQVWEGKHWEGNAIDHATEMAKGVVMAMYPELAELGGTDRDALYKHAKRSESQASIRAMIKLAESDPAVRVSADDFDRDPWLFNCANGTIELRTGAIREHRRADMITKLAPVDYDPRATCPTWDAFLRRVMAGNDDLTGFVQRAAGYSLTGLTSERSLFILHGGGKNGKSTLLEVLRAVMGDYAKSTPAETLMAQRNDQIPHDVARLVGVRFVTAVEAEDERRFAEAKVKQLTGGDTISARRLYAELFDFIPTFKVWLATNHKPNVRGTDEAMWYRLKLIPFDVRIPPEDQDPGLRRKLLAEAPGILAWMVRGCLDWQQGGLREPHEVKAATAIYRVEMDLLGKFIAERCVLADNATASSKALYADYVSWCEQSGEKAMSRNMLGRRLGDRGLTRKHGERGDVYQGIELLSGEG
jgi:putative DNA primase/helicase